jgi:hypothetical protein
LARFCIDVEDVPGIYPSWQDRLREVRGIYVLVDKETGQQYVGSAKGEDSLWGRFADYARTGHGGNVELKRRPGARYQVGVLQVVDESLPDHSIEQIETWWKRKLMTREHGLTRTDLLPSRWPMPVGAWPSSLSCRIPGGPGCRLPARHRSLNGRLAPGALSLTLRRLVEHLQRGDLIINQHRLAGRPWRNHGRIRTVRGRKLNGGESSWRGCQALA